MIEQLGVELDNRGNVKSDENYTSSVPGVFAAGDMRRGIDVKPTAKGLDPKAERFHRGRIRWPVHKCEKPLHIETRVALPGQRGATGQMHLPRIPEGSRW